MKSWSDTIFVFVSMAFMLQPVASLSLQAACNAFRLEMPRQMFILERNESLIDISSEYFFDRGYYYIKVGIDSALSEPVVFPNIGIILPHSDNNGRRFKVCCGEDRETRPTNCTRRRDWCGRGWFQLQEKEQDSIQLSLHPDKTDTLIELLKTWGIRYHELSLLIMTNDPGRYVILIESGCITVLQKFISIKANLY